jgi:hypothetical protein
MKRPNMLLKVVTVASSLLLVGGCVAYQSGAFDRFMWPKAQPAESGTSPVVEENGTTQPPTTTMPSTKSFRPVNVLHGPIPAGSLLSDLESQTPPSTTTAPPGSTPPAPTVMSGTKSPFIQSIQFQQIPPFLKPTSESKPASPAP